MSKAKFTYDESGNTFFYFVLSFLALILIPSTYYLWPNELEAVKSKLECRCNGCQNKQKHLAELYKWKRSRRQIIRFILAIGWLAFFMVAYKCATTQNEYVNWDPYEILGIREGASLAEIKRAYRSLSLIYHPDKETGNPDLFVKITKAHLALTDEEARKNWELHGNPDGPGATSFGIALPSWIVEKENSFVVLGIYALIFMVALPVSVGLWWYKSVKYGCDKVLINTSELYYYFIHKTPNMPLKRVIMILTASLEFAKTHNPEVVERPTDNYEVPRLIRDLPNLGEKNKERPLCFSYSIKARAILHAHLSRIKLPENTLELDRCFIVSKCPYLIQEFVQCIAQLITLALSGRIQNMPTLSTLENGMKLSALVVQAVWEYQSPLLQLPHFTEDTLRHFDRKRIKIRTIEPLARMKETDRRAALKNFTDSQYDDIYRVLEMMPVVSVESKFEVLDDEDPGLITAGAIVTVTLTLKRRFMRDLFNKGDQAPADRTDQSAVDTAGEETTATAEKESTLDETESDTSSDCDSDAVLVRRPNATSQANDELGENKENNNNNNSNNKSATRNNSDGKKKPQKAKGTGGSVQKVPLTDKNTSDNETISRAVAADSDPDDDDWDRKFQERVIKKQKAFESKPRKSHPVHCPYYPEDKQEFWWVYVCDRKRFALVTAPLLVTSLVEKEEIELKFTAPHRPGTYTYTIVVRSDSYVDCVVQKVTRIDVKPAREFVEVAYEPPEEDLEMDMEEESAVEDSDLMTDTDED